MAKNNSAPQQPPPDPAYDVNDGIDTGAMLPDHQLQAEIAAAESAASTFERSLNDESPTESQREMNDIELELGDEHISLLNLDESTMDPSLRYRFVTNLPQRVMRMRAMGYSMISWEDGILIKHSDFLPPESVVQQTGPVIVGDAVLMACSKELWLRRQELKNRLNAARLRTAEAGVVKEAERGGVRLIHDQPFTTGGRR